MKTAVRAIARPVLRHVPFLRPVASHAWWYLHCNPLSFALSRLRGETYREWYTRVLDSYADSSPRALDGLELRMGETQRDFLIGHGLRPHHSVLDFGCGALRAGVPLIAYLDAGRYTGVDISAGRLAQGMRRVAEFGLAEKRPQVLPVHGVDLVELRGQEFDFIWAQGVLAHMPLSDIAAVLGNVRRIMHRGSIFFVNYGDGGEQTYTRLLKDFYYARGVIEDLCASQGLRVEVVRDWRAGTDLPAGEKDRMLRLTPKDASPA